MTASRNTVESVAVHDSFEAIRHDKTHDRAAKKKSSTAHFGEKTDDRRNGGRKKRKAPKLPKWRSRRRPSTKKKEAPLDATNEPPKKGKRRALMIGINYSQQKNAKKLRLPPITYDSEDELFGCIDDSDTLTAILAKTGWKNEDMRIMTDESKQAHLRPTRQNLVDSFKWLVADAKPGDVFFLSFSGHGMQDIDRTGFEEDGLNETILPLDYEINGDITDDQLNDLLVRPLPDGCRLFALIDACHSGTMLDLPFELQGNRKWREETNPNYSRGDVQLLAGCRDYEKSSDGDNGGAMTQAFVRVLKRNPQGVTYPQLLNGIHRELRREKFHQRPMLTSSQKFDENRLFVIDDIMPNHNSMIGRLVRKRFKAAPERPRTWQAVRFLVAFMVTFGICIGFGFLLVAAFGLGQKAFIICAVVGGVLGIIVGIQFLPENIFARIRLHALRITDALFPPKNDGPDGSPVLYLGGKK